MSTQEPNPGPAAAAAQFKKKAVHINSVGKKAFSASLISTEI